MGLCFVGCLVLFRSAAGLSRDGLRSRPDVPSRSEHARFTMRFLVTGAAGAVREDFLDAFLVCLRSAALTRSMLRLNLQFAAIQIHCSESASIARALRRNSPERALFYSSRYFRRFGWSNRARRGLKLANLTAFQHFLSRVDTQQGDDHPHFSTLVVLTDRRIALTNELVLSWSS